MKRIKLAVVFGLISLGSLSSSQSAVAHEWEKFVDCDNGNLVLDRAGWEGNYSYQVVLRGQPLVHFLGNDALPGGNLQNDEFVANLNVYDSQYFAARSLSAPPIEYLVMWVSLNRRHNSAQIHVQKERRLGSGGSLISSWDFYNCWFR